MGCDIHLYREKQVGGKWLAADKWEKCKYDDEGENTLVVEYANRAYTGRNYQLFSTLCRGVRGEHDYSFEPRGLPFNACVEIADKAEDWGVDGHGHSYLYLHELKDMAKYLERAIVIVTGMKDAAELKELRASIDSGAPNWDLLFPYCGWGSSPTLEEFTLEVPASFYMGSCLQKIIDSFEGIEGDNHRIVFFFDN